MKAANPYIPLPEVDSVEQCVCGSGERYGSCCEPRLLRLNRAMAGLERWRDDGTFEETFQVYSDLLWEEQYRDEEQGKAAQLYEEWDEWASYLWLEGVVLDGFNHTGRPAIADLLRDRISAGERFPGGRDTLEGLLDSFEGIYEIADIPPGDSPGLVTLWHPPNGGPEVAVPRVFLPPDTEPSDMVIGRFVPVGPVWFPTHRPLVIPMLKDGSNFDAAYSVIAGLLPPDPENAGAYEMMRRFLKARGDMVLRAALEALLPLEADHLRSQAGPEVVDGGELHYLVSDQEAAESYLHQSHFFEVVGPVEQERMEEELGELLDNGELAPVPAGPRWRLSIGEEGLRRLRPDEREQVEELLWAIARRSRPPFDADPITYWSENPGFVVLLDGGDGSLSARALYAPALELGRYLLEREVGPFLARSGEEPLTG